MLFLLFFATFTSPFMEGRTTPVLSIGVSFGIVETVSSNGRIRGQPQRRGFESHAIPFLFSIVLKYGRMNEGLHVPEKEKAPFLGLSRHLIVIEISKGSV